MKTLKDFTNRIICGDCIKVMQEIPAESVDFVLTDPPYLVNYHSRDGRSVYRNDDPNDTTWLAPAFREVYRVLKPNRYCVSFYGYHRADAFLQAWRAAGFRTVEHFVWVKGYASSKGLAQRTHEQAYLLTKGSPPPPHLTLSNVLAWRYTGNRLHPTQKPLGALLPLINAYSTVGDIVLDPFAGSGTTAVAAKQLGRRYIAIELSPAYYHIAQERLKKGGDTFMAWKPQRQQNSPKRQENTAKRANTQTQDFWATCKSCNNKFTVPQAWVFKYLERIGYTAKEE